MAETTNNFTGAKMNKDIDDRLIAENEYRNAINLQISKSENSDVGALQTILGNELVIDFNTLTGSTNLDCIGYFVDTANSRVFLFLTNYTDTTLNGQYNKLADNYIYLYNSLQNTYTKLVEGPFLNFSKTNPIIGVNLLEDLLFWTDNRNQPRKINISRALNSITYYTIEDQISVAKLSPVYAIDLYKTSALELASTATVGTVSGSGPYTAEITPGLTFPASLITIGDIVYATPGASDFTSGEVTAVNTTGPNLVSFTVSSDTIFTSGTISLLYVNRDETTMYNVTDEFLPISGSTAIVDGAISATNTFVIDDPGLPEFWPKPGQLISSTDPLSDIPSNIRVVSYNDTTFTVVVDANITLADNLEVKFNANPYYNPDYIGDPTFLENKFVRFSYRYKFDDNEYSIFAPFTQIAYIPRQDGYFLYEPNPDPLQEPIIDDETAAYRSTIVSFMYNKVNNILLQIKLPCNANELQSKFKISEVEILYKESDGLAVQTVDVIPYTEIASQAGTGDVYVYNYQSKKPFRTLPERDTLRVYDKTPVRALGQEIASNRVIYSNYQDKQGYPKFLNYNVACNEKSPFNLLANTTSLIEYPNHSVKQNRNYEVGIILSDKFGRQSGVILSNALSSFNNSFGAASLYVPYKEETSPGSEIPEDGLVNQWPGLSLKVLFNNPIDGGGISDWPGIYNGEATEDDYNPLGWYSYKIVVKQNEQDYYNVYLPGMMAAYPMESLKELDKTSHFVLIGDNINKVPRDLNDVSNTQEQYRSSVKLYSRVNNIEPDWQNQQFYPGNSFSFVNTIATVNSLFSPPATLPIEYDQFYQVDSNPLIGRLTTDTKLGITTAEAGVSEPPKTIRLAVAETDPFDSRLDIYWETSTSGIISELNEAIIAGSDAPSRIENWNFGFNEAAEPMDPDDNPVDDFYFVDTIGTLLEIPLGDITMTVTDGVGNPRNEFIITNGSAPGKFNIDIVDYFYYGFNAIQLESYVFTFTVNTFIPFPTTSTFTKNGALSNVAPTITNKPAETVYPSPLSPIVYQFEGVNGSNPSGGRETENLTWSIIEFEDNLQFQIDPVTGLLTKSFIETDEGITNLTVILTDAGGLIDQCIITIDISSTAGINTFVTSGGPGIISTQATGTFNSVGYITVEDGYNCRVRAGAFPFPDGLNSVQAQVTLVGYSALFASAYDGDPGTYSFDDHILPGPGTYYFNNIFVNYSGEGGTGGMYLQSI
jgi:hypothetical protein